MPLPELIATLLTLLVTPGPTNTLLALAGAERGTARAMRLLPAVPLAYLMTTVPLALAGQTLLEAFPPFRIALTLAAALWVAWLAVRLWRLPAGGETKSGISASTIFTATLLNPKGLVIGLVLLPSSSALAPPAAVLALAAVLVSAAWVVLGGILARRGVGGASSSLPVLRRVGACWLGVLSVGLAAALGVPG